MPRNSYYLPQRGLTTQKDAALIERANIPRSKVHNSWRHLTTIDAGLIYPFMVEDILPGTHVTYDVTAFARMQTLLFPLMDDQRIDTHFFFVPYRLLWTNWVKMMGEQTSPGDSINFTVPQMVSPVAGYIIGELHDHMGCGTLGQVDPAQTITHSSLPFRAYNQIYNAWFRDENLVNTQVIDLGNGPDTYSNYGLQRRAKTHDYFTSALPFTQKFTTSVAPLQGFAPVGGIGLSAFVADTAGLGVYDTIGEGVIRNYPHAQTGGLPALAIATSTAGGVNLQISAALGQTSTGATVPPGMAINAFRQAMMIQALLERDARGGTRYTELIEAHFGVRNPDARLQRPEYIGGGQTPLNVTPIAQTATGGGGLAALGGTGTGAGRHRATYAATEHGVILGLVSIKTNLTYSQGMNALWFRSSRYDFYWPALAQLGEQPVYMRELYQTGVPANDTTVFGYQEAWQPYRTRPSEITGMFRPRAAGAISQWHLAQNFNPAPALNRAFIEDTPDVARVLAAGAAANKMQYLMDIAITRTAVLPVPTYGTPAILGRF